MPEINFLQSGSLLYAKNSVQKRTSFCREYVSQNIAFPLYNETHSPNQKANFFVSKCLKNAVKDFKSFFIKTTWLLHCNVSMCRSRNVCRCGTTWPYFKLFTPSLFSASDLGKQVRIISYSISPEMLTFRCLTLK